MENYLEEMEQNEEITLPSTSSVGGGEGAVDKGAAAVGAPTITTKTTIPGFPGETAVAVNAATTKVYTTEELEALSHSVFSNQLITDKITPYLSFGDMKAARLVSRSFLEMIESNERFKDAAVLVVKRGNCLLIDLDCLSDSTDRIWRGIKIDVTLPSERLMEIPGHILQDVEFVSCLVCGTLGKNDARPILPLLHILRSTPKITHLQMDIRLFEGNLTDVFSCSAVRKNLKDLKRFEILGYTSICGISDRVYSPYDYEKRLTENVLYLAKEEILRSLESLRVPKVTYPRCIAPLHFQDAVIKLIKLNVKTLREIAVHLDVWGSGIRGSNNDIAAVTLPHLTSLTVKVRASGQDRLKDFLTNHPSLEELDLTAEDYIGGTLWDVIKEQSANLKKLRLKTKGIFDWAGRGGAVDWTFLEGMTRLQDFALVRPYDNKNAKWDKFGSGVAILESLPKNQLERLSFRGIGSTDHGSFWTCWNSHNWGVEEEDVLSLPEKLELLREFRNVKCLSFRRCPGALDDDVMQFVVKEMTCLEKLEVSKCADLTDHGIFGRDSEDGSSDSIRNLKGLKELRLRSCPSLTPQKVLSSLELPFLRRFYYSAEESVPKSSVLRMISRNPCLESVSVKFSDEGGLPNVSHLRLETLVNLASVYAAYESDDDGCCECDVTTVEGRRKLRQQGHSMSDVLMYLRYKGSYEIDD